VLSWFSGEDCRSLLSLTAPFTSLGSRGGVEPTYEKRAPSISRLSMSSTPSSAVWSPTTAEIDSPTVSPSTYGGLSYVDYSGVETGGGGYLSQSGSSTLHPNRVSIPPPYASRSELVGGVTGK